MPTRKDPASFPSMTLNDHSKAWSSKEFGHNSSTGFSREWVPKLSLNPPVPLLLYFVVVVTAISYFQRSVERSAAKNMEAPMTVGEKCEKQKGRKKKVLNAFPFKQKTLLKLHFSFFTYSLLQKYQIANLTVYSTNKCAISNRNCNFGTATLQSVL